MRKREKLQSGFTLVELMVALVIGLLVIAGAIQIFVMAKRSFDELDALASRQDALRFITDVIGADVRTTTALNIAPYALNAATSELSCNPVEGEPEDLGLVFGDDYTRGLVLRYEANPVLNRHPRENDPHCAAGQRLDRVIYMFSDQNISMCMVCEGESYGPFSLHENVAFSFDVDGLSYVSNEHVELSVLFDDDLAKKGADSEFRFVFSSRSAVRQ